MGTRNARSRTMSARYSSPDSPSGARALAESALDTFGRVDVVVSSATPAIQRKPFLELSWDEVDTYWRTYVQAAFTLAQELAPGMKERQFGRFVHILTSYMWGSPPQDLTGCAARAPLSRIP